MPYANANQDRMLFVSGYPEQRPYNFLNYVMDVSSAQTRIEIDNNSFVFGPGKQRKAVINYFAPECDVQGDCGQGLCTTGEVIQMRQMQLDITKCFATKVYTFRADDLRLVDNQWTFTQAARETINAVLPQVRRSLAQKMLAEVYMLAGVHSDGSLYGPKKLKFVDFNTGVINPTARVAIESEYSKLGFQSPVISGGDDIFYLQKLVGQSGLSADGLELGRTDTSRLYYDDGLSALVLNDIINGGHLLTIDPQMFKMVTFLKNAGMFAAGVTSFEQFEQMRGTTAPDWGKTTFLDSVTGIVWDLYINFDKCTDAWSWHLELNYDFFVMPPYECVTEGINGIMRWRSCPDVIVDCPAGSPIPSPTGGTEYSWTPGTIWPRYVSNMTIGNITTQPNVTITSLADLVAMMNANYASDIFEVDGSDVVYTGYTALEGTINLGEVDITFA